MEHHILDLREVLHNPIQLEVRHILDLLEALHIRKLQEELHS
jgi:hypothetical protein